VLEPNQIWLGSAVLVRR